MNPKKYAWSAVTISDPVSAGDGVNGVTKHCGASPTRMTRMETSLIDRCEAFFRARPRVWVDAHELEAVAGRQAWRTRVSDLRRHRGMTIENWLTKWPSGRKRSLYRFVPPVSAPHQLDLWR